uniref:phage tail spike protein n=1 Tax=Streptococcus pseudopneumoniae TaxID=257758 RepID=UPI00066AEB8F
MIYLTNGNMPLNAAYADEIVQEDNSTYQLSFRFPTSDSLWEKLKEETFLTADDLHGEQDFVIFEVEKKHGYIQVYANQVFTLLNNYVVNPISLDRQTGSTALSRFAGSITRDNPFSFFSDIEDRHTFNIGSKNAMEAFAKDKHSIIGQWGGDLVRHGYQVRLLKKGGSENESLFMYKKNLSSYQHKTSTKSLKTRITFIATVKGEGEKAPDRTFTVTIDSPLINKYSQIYEDVIEVNDQDVKDEASLRKYGEQYYRTSLCDMMEDSLEIEVVGQSDVPVQMFDVVSIFHERYNLDVRKKITKYTYSPMAKKLKSIGFGQFQSGLANAIGNAVSDAVKGEAQQLQGNFERQLAREIKNADLAFDRQKEELVNQFTDGLNATRARAEEVKQELSDTIDQRFSSFNNGPLQEIKRRAEEALRNAGASSLLAQEAKRIGLDSIAKLEAFKTQATSAQTNLSGAIDALKQTIANDIRPKQAQAEAEIAKQIEALFQTKKELSGVKSAQVTYEETTTRRLSELTNLANGKASKSELTQTAEELASKLASVQASGRNLFLNSLFKQDISKTGIWTTSTYEATIDSTDKYLGHNALKIVGQNPSGRDGGNPKITYPALGQYGKNVPGSMTNQDVTISFYAKASKNGIMLKSRLGNINYKTGNVALSTEIKRYVVHIPKGWTNESKFTTNEWLFNFNQEGTVWIWMPKFEISDVDTSYSEAPEDIEGQISTVESNFRQRADALDAGVRSLTEGLRTKADISSLNVTAENIRQSVKSLETSTQNKLDQKLSMTEFEVRAGSIHQEILNATKDKADKTLVMTEAGKLREEFSNLRVGGTNLLKGSKGPFLPDRKPANFDNAILYAGNTSIYMEQGQEYIISAKTDGTFTAHHDGNKESDNVVLWIMDKDVRNYQIVSDLKTGTTGTKITWNKPTGIYHLRVNTYHKEATKSVWDVKIEKGNVATDWSPAPEDTDGLITEAKAIFERTAQGLRTDLSAIQEYVNKDGQRQEALQRYTREESAKQATAVRELVTRDYVGKATYQEDVKGINQRIEAVKTSANKEISSQIASYRQSVDGKFTDISSQITTYKQDLGDQISGLSNRITSNEQETTTQISNLTTQISDNKANADSQFVNVTNQLAQKVEITDFQKVKETSQLYERILGNTDNGIADNVARMAMTNQLFQIEVSKNEGLKTVQRQIAGSWAVQNINSEGDLISGINLGANGYNRFDGKLTHITGETLIDNAVIKSAMVDKLKTANFEAGSVTTVILDAEAVTAEKLKVDQAFFNKLVANEAYLSQLFAKQAFINRVQSVAIDASQVRSGILSGDRIYGGTIRGANIYGGTLIGHTQIQLGTYGSFDTVNGGIQINVPRTVNAKDGLGVQFIGSYGRGENVPYGLFIYKDADFTVGGTAETSDDFLLTVEGYINAKGIGWLKTGKGSVNGKTTGTIGLWNSDNVSLSFGGSGNDIYYSYNGTAYSLWSVVNQHFSDRRLKDNIVACEHKALDYIQQFRFKEYDWRKQEDRPQQAHTKIGLIAQEVQAVDPTLVYENGDTLNLDNLRLTNIALKAIQELALENQKLTHRLE